MSRRTQIIDFVVTELKRINGNTDSRSAPTRSGYEYKTNVFNNVFFIEALSCTPENRRKS